jgi:Flp pilus assembly protein protease CpaA
MGLDRKQLRKDLNLLLDKLKGAFIAIGMFIAAIIFAIIFVGFFRETMGGTDYIPFYLEMLIISPLLIIEALWVYSWIKRRYFE